jgi:hypothetical protein
MVSFPSFTYRLGSYSLYIYFSTYFTVSNPSSCSITYTYSSIPLDSYLYFEGTYLAAESLYTADAGSYSITVTGTSGSSSMSSTFTLDIVYDCSIDQYLFYHNDDLEYYEIGDPATTVFDLTYVLFHIGPDC